MSLTIPLRHADKEKKRGEPLPLFRSAAAANYLMKHGRVRDFA